MKRNFLLDENVVVKALLHEGTRDLWLMIANKCHRIAVSSLLAARYRDKLRQARRRVPPEVATATSAIINQILTNSEKTIWVEPKQSSALARLIRHANDHFLGDIAAEVLDAHKADHCIFVSTDGRTRADFNRAEMRSAGIRGVTIERGLDLASAQDG